MPTTKHAPGFQKNLFERTAWQQGEVVCGVDEVGRSCLAGPVVAAAAIIPPRTRYTLLKDSKLLTQAQREQAYGWLVKRCRFGVGIVHHRTIDAINIYHATLVAMKRAVMQLFAASRVQPVAVLVDAMPLQLVHSDLPVIHFPFGEEHSSSIAAASIIAKVTRDRIMTRFDGLTPGYAYTANKGYGTKAHREGIEHNGVTLMHRMSFKINQELG